MKQSRQWEKNWRLYEKLFYFFLHRNYLEKAVKISYWVRM